MGFSLFPINGTITWVFWELSVAGEGNPLAFPIAVSREARKIVAISLIGPLLLDNGYLTMK